MASLTFVDNLTVIPAAWSNDIDYLAYDIFSFTEGSPNLSIGTNDSASLLHVGDDGSGDSNYITIGKGFDATSGIQWQRSGVIDAAIEVDNVEDFVLTYNKSLTTNNLIIKNDVTTVLTLDSSNNATFAGDLAVDGVLNLGTKSERTISAGVITVTKSWHTVDTEATDATDDLDTINGGADGDLLVIRAKQSGRTVVVKDLTGNISLNGDFTMDNRHDTLTLLYDSTIDVWLELARSDNGV